MTHLARTIVAALAAMLVTATVTDTASAECLAARSGDLCHQYGGLRIYLLAPHSHQRLFRRLRRRGAALERPGLWLRTRFSVFVGTLFGSDG